MGICSSLCNHTEASHLVDNDDIASLIKAENLTAEVMGQALVPPAPLLKEINFAAIADGNSDDDQDDISDLDDDVVNELLNEEEDD